MEFCGFSQMRANLAFVTDAHIKVLRIIVWNKKVRQTLKDGGMATARVDNVDIIIRVLNQYNYLVIFEK